MDTSTKRTIIETYWETNQGLKGATAGAREIEEIHGIPVNTVRGLQFKMYPKGARPWNLPPVQDTAADVEQVWTPEKPKTPDHRWYGYRQNYELWFKDFAGEVRTLIDQGGGYLIDSRIIDIEPHWQIRGLAPYVLEASGGRLIAENIESGWNHSYMSATWSLVISENPDYSPDSSLLDDRVALPEDVQAPGHQDMWIEEEEVSVRVSGRGRVSRKSMTTVANEGRLSSNTHPITFPTDGHTCPCCAKHAKGFAEINEMFGFRAMTRGRGENKTKVNVQQSQCRACRKKHAAQAREHAKKFKAAQDK